MGVLPADININIVLIMLHGFFSGVIKNWLMAPEKFDLYLHAPELVDNIMLAVKATSTRPVIKEAIAC